MTHYHSGVWLSNALCNGVTGDAVFQRVLHSDEDISVYYFQRVIALTTIAIRHDVADDLTDRIPLVEPEVIEVRRTEVDITAARAAALPAGLGAALDLVAGVLRELPGTAVDNAPRMADFPRSWPRSTPSPVGTPWAATAPRSPAWRCR